MNTECAAILELGGLDLAALEEDKCVLCRWSFKLGGGEILDGTLYCANRCQFPPEGCERPANAGKDGRRNVYLFCYWAWQNADMREVLERAEVAA